MAWFRYGLLAVSIILTYFFYLTDSFPYRSIFLYVLTISLFFLSFFSFKKLRKVLLDYIIDLVIAGLLMLTAFPLYLYRITEITPGVWGDEVSLGWMAEELLYRTTFTPFLTDNLGHPTILIYISSLFISLLGRSVLSLRLVSVIFGSLSIAAFYLFLRRFFDRSVSASGAVLLMTSYVFIIVTRFAYEMSAAVFIFICAAAGLVLLSSKITPVRVVVLGVTLGLGLYTYVAFRPIAVLFLIYGIVLITKTKTRWKLLSLFLISFMLVISPLLTYSLHHPKDINERVLSLSVFHQNLPVGEVMKELQGASFRTVTMFIFTGDPNPRQNPAGTPPFDLITSSLFFAGLGFLWIKQRKLFLPLVLVMAFVLITEIITLERIPEFHYYGLGHPNTLRISLLVPTVIFGVMWIVQFVSTKLPKHIWRLTWIIGLTILIAIINVNHYFNQKSNVWIYATNFVIPMKVITMLNEQKPKHVALSKSLYEVQHIRYFLDPHIAVEKMSDPIDCSFTKLLGNYSIMGGQDLKNCSQEQIQALTQNLKFATSFMRNPWQTIDAAVVQKL